MNTKNIIKKYKLDRSTWTHKSFHGILHFFFPVGRVGLNELRDYYGDSHHTNVFYFHDNICEWYWNDKDMIRLRKSFIKKVNNQPKILDKLLHDWHKRLRIFNKVLHKIDNINLLNLSNDELINLYFKFHKFYMNEYSIAVGLQDPFSMHSDDFLLPYFKEIIENKKLSSKFHDYYAILTSPVTESFIIAEYRDRLKLLKNKNPNLKKHSLKYHWLQNNYAKDTYLDEKFFKKKLNEIKKTDPDKELARLDNELRKLKKNKNKIIKELKLSKESLNLIRITEVFAYMQDERKKYVLKAIYYQNKFMNEFGKRLHLSKKHMEYTHISELKDLLKKKIDKRAFEQRKKNSLTIHSLKGSELITGKTAKELHEKIFERKVGAITELKGTVACQGMIKGTVKIIRKKHDIVNMHQGDILVASMTRPEMILAMKKASAIVTDEGGITSHAAIVSRELNIPCIIGTKIATKVLKDGDLIEVDANKGIVRKIK